MQGVILNLVSAAFPKTRVATQRESGGFAVELARAVGSKSHRPNSSQVSAPPGDVAGNQMQQTGLAPGLSGQAGEHAREIRKDDQCPGDSMPAMQVPIILPTGVSPEITHTAPGNSSQENSNPGFLTAWRLIAGHQPAIGLLPGTPVQDDIPLAQLAAGGPVKLAEERASIGTHNATWAMPGKDSGFPAGETTAYGNQQPPVPVLMEQAGHPPGSQWQLIGHAEDLPATGWSFALEREMLLEREHPLHRLVSNHEGVFRPQPPTVPVPDASTGGATPRPEATFQGLLAQMVEQAKLMVNGKRSEMVIRLKPEYLGKVHLKVAVVEGVVTARFLVDNVRVGQVLEVNLPQLRQTLQDAGLRFQQASVDVGGQFMGAAGWEQQERETSRAWQPKMSKSQGVVQEELAATVSRSHVNYLA